LVLEHYQPFPGWILSSIWRLRGDYAQIEIHFKFRWTSSEPTSPTNVAHILQPHSYAAMSRSCLDRMNDDLELRFIPRPLSPFEEISNYARFRLRIYIQMLPSFLINAYPECWLFHLESCSRTGFSRCALIEPDLQDGNSNVRLNAICTNLLGPLPRTPALPKWYPCARAWAGSDDSGDFKLTCAVWCHLCLSQAKDKAGLLKQCLMAS
jgi:hypothetical protein